MAMTYTVAPVRIALDSISQMCDGGAEITFKKNGGFIRNPDDTITEFQRVDNAYVRDIWIDAQEDQTAFKGQRETS